MRPEDMPSVRALHDASFRGLGAAYDAATKAAHAALVMAPDYAPDVLRSDLWLAEQDGRLLGSAGWIVNQTVHNGLLNLERRIAAERGIAINRGTIAKRAGPGPY